jgi:N-formylglutamate amidohydrolase
VLHVPHASTVIPAEERARLLLDDEGLAAELRAMTDAHTDLVAARASGLAARSPWQFVNRLSRLVIDPERFTEPGAEEMEAVGMGAVYTGTHDLRRLRPDDPRHRADLLAAYFTPYAEALADLVDERLAAQGRAVLVDVHSYPARPLPHERHADLRRPEVCLGVDDGHTPGWLRHAAEVAFAGFELGINEPFIGTYVPTRHYQRDVRVSSIMIEIRRDLYLGTGGEPLELGVRKLASALGALVDAIDASR